jgi:hypothetical protein
MYLAGQADAWQARQNYSLKEPAMKRMHVHITVDDLKQAIGFYSTLFAAQPSGAKVDYAKWMLDDPRMNFAISRLSTIRAGRISPRL